MLIVRGGRSLGVSVETTLTSIWSSSEKNRSIRPPERPSSSWSTPAAAETIERPLTRSTKSSNVVSRTSSNLTPASGKARHVEQFLQPVMRKRYTECEGVGRKSAARFPELAENTSGTVREFYRAQRKEGAGGCFRSRRARKDERLTFAMAIFTEYDGQRPLPAVGHGYERATLDLKARCNLGKTVHLAKDVAAFANHLGGTILVGATEANSRVGAYTPLTEADTAATQDAISKAVADRCSPRPVLDFARYREGTGFVLAVNVQPFIGQAVGVRVMADKASGGYGGDAYAFPLRSGSDSAYLLPEQLAMYMLPNLRRLEIMLAPLQPGDRITVLGRTGQGVPAQPHVVKFKTIDVRLGSLTVEFDKNLAGSADACLPLDAIRGIWKADKRWHLSVKGQINPADGQFSWHE